MNSQNLPEQVKQTKPKPPENGVDFWPLGDKHSAVKLFGVGYSDRSYRSMAQLTNRSGAGMSTLIAAEWDGKPKRCPKAGEWYLRRDCASRALDHGLSSEHWIARIVRLRATVSVQITVEGEVGN